MLKVNYYIGLNDKDTKKQETKTDKAKAIITKLIDNFTIYEAMGVFTHEDGTKVYEKSLVVMVVTDDGLELVNNRVNYIVNELKAKLNQESIMVEIQESYIKFM